MCDTIYKATTKEKFFAKNSDRGCNEPNLCIYYPRRTSQAGATLRCTYVSIEDSTDSNAIFVVKPSWTWGAEMGVNEYGVCVGNEAVFTKTQSKKPNLIGMDYRTA